MRLKHKVASVTGAGRGIGLGIALACAREGARVALCDVRAALRDDALAEIEPLGGEAVAFQMDVTRKDQILQVVDETLSPWGTIDILVNSAGIVSLKPTVEFPVEEWQQIIDVNLRGTFICCKEVGKVMLEQARGKIINLSPVRGLQGRANDPARPASKGAVNLLTKRRGHRPTEAACTDVRTK